jgi:quinoprotein dehydrogenase-associated probable ABC transporter substrate-binding protein
MNLKKIIFLLFGAFAFNNVLSQDLNFKNWDTLRVCSDPNSMPQSNRKEEGFENKIAELFADELNWKIKYEWFPQRLAFFRNTIKAKDPTSASGYKCDIAIGASPDPEGASGTKTYYTSTWVVVLPDNAAFKDVNSSEDILKLDKIFLKSIKFGVFARSPGADWIVKNEFSGQMVPFVHMQSDPNDYPGMIIEKSLATGDIDVAFAWGPIAAFSVSNVTKRKLKLVPLIPSKEMRTDYSIAMAVRYGEPEWKNIVENFIDKNENNIQKIISDFGVPLVNNDGSVFIGNKKYYRKINTN